MKKIFLLFIVIILSVNTFAQTSSIYVIFTKTSSKNVPGIDHWTSSITNKTKYRYASQYFMVAQAGLHQFFDYSALITEPDNPIITKPTSFLNTVTYIDWDVVGPTLQTFQQVKAKVDQIMSYEKIYFIDRTEIVNGNMKIVPVKPVISRY